MDKKITVKIFTLSKGLEMRNDIKAIRIKSDKYNLLIMVDYIPIIGEINGSIDCEAEENSISYQNIKAYFMHSNNVFSLIINEEQSVQPNIS
jgi:uncharacterized protein (UPF0254 family)